MEMGACPGQFGISAQYLSTITSCYGNKKIMITPKEEVILLGIVFVGRFHNN